MPVGFVTQSEIGRTGVRDKGPEMEIRELRTEARRMQESQRQGPRQVLCTDSLQGVLLCCDWHLKLTLAAARCTECSRRISQLEP